MGTIFQNPAELVKELEKAIQIQDARHKYDIEKLQREIKRLKDPLIKSKTIADLKEEIEETRKDLYRGFPITIAENERITKWQDEHIQKYHGGNPYAGAIGGRFEYLFIPTSIGTIGTCFCGLCKKKEELNKDEYSYTFSNI